MLPTPLGRDFKHRTSIAVASAATFCAFALALFGAGCGDDDNGPTGPGAPQDTYMVASSAFAAANRMLETYMAQDLYFYDQTLTRNFRFIFANADPAMQAMWDSSWTITIEDSTARHLFDGFDYAGTWRSKAETIQIIYGGLNLGIDPAHQDSTNHYQRVRMLGWILDVVLEDGTNYHGILDLNAYVVRGDVAILGPGQSRDSTIWYVRQVVENAEPPAPPIRLDDRADAAVIPVTWGRLRELYSWPRAKERHAF